MHPDVRARLSALLGSRVKFGEPLARYTSFRLGGPAEIFAEPHDPQQLAAVLSLTHRHRIPTFVLGGGTNLLVSDRGVSGVVIKLGGGFRFREWREEGDSVRARVGAAVPLGRFVRETLRRGYAGLEFAEGIPGTVGGNVLMNAGAFGGEVGRVVDAVEGLARDGTAARLPAACGGGLRFHYRKADVPEGFVVTAVELRLARDDRRALHAAALGARRRRSLSQPRGHPNAGSIFKNPKGDFAGRLIEAAGLKGLSLGGARVSERHANFIVNAGGATAAQVKALMDTIQKTVWERSQVWLEPEVRLVGEW